MDRVLLRHGFSFVPDLAVILDILDVFCLEIALVSSATVWGFSLFVCCCLLCAADASWLSDWYRRPMRDSIVASGLTRLTLALTSIYIYFNTVEDVNFTC